MQATLLFLGILAFVQAGPYTKKARPVAKTPLVAAAQLFLEERLLAVELRVLKTSLDVGRLAQETTRYAYRLSEEARVRAKELGGSLLKEGKMYRPLTPKCSNTSRIKETALQIDKEAEEAYVCTHRVADEGASFEVAATVQLNEVRNQIWHVQEAMYYCEKYQEKADRSCLKRLIVEGLQVINRLPDRVGLVLDSAQAAAAQSRDRLQDCYNKAMSRAEEYRLEESQTMRECVQALKSGRGVPGKGEGVVKVLGKRGKNVL